MSPSSFLISTLLLTPSLLRSVSALPLPAPCPFSNDPANDSGNATTVTVSSNKTLNATAPAASSGGVTLPYDSSASLPLTLVNYLGSNNVHAYISGLNALGQLIFLGPDGEFYYPSTTSTTPQEIPRAAISIPLGAAHSNTNIVIPGYISSARVYLADGDLKFFVVATPNGPGLVEPAAVNPNDPSAGLNWGFAELTWIANYGLYADISFVDFVGLPLGMQLTVTDGTGTQSALGLVSDAVPLVCTALRVQSIADGMPWGDECVYTTSGELIRVLAPQDIISTTNGLFTRYFDQYVRDVFAAYSSTPLRINTQTDAGIVNCYADTSSMLLTCEGDNRPYAAPSARDIFGCNSGPFAIQAGDNAVHYAVVPRLCAAFNRGTFLVEGGDLQPQPSPEEYYTSTQGVYNYFSKFTHQWEKSNRGYAFAYDDVAASGDKDVSGSVVSGHPETLTIFVGGYDLA